MLFFQIHSQRDAEKPNPDLEVNREVAFLKATVEDRDKEIEALKAKLETEKSHVLNLEKASRLNDLEHTNKLSELKKELDKGAEEKEKLLKELEVMVLEQMELLVKHSAYTYKNSKIVPLEIMYRIIQLREQDSYKSPLIFYGAICNSNQDN